MRVRKPLSNSVTVLIANVPVSFDLLKAFKSAKRIWIASAFAHKSGWTMLREALLNSQAKITLISGLDFCQTEPWVLKDWIGKEFSRRGSRSFLYIGQEIFHPKVFVIEGQARSFALVGSGNLSAGGLGKNVECFAYIDGASATREVVSWLRKITEDRERCVPLKAEHIKAYEPKWRAASKSRGKIKQQERAVSKQITSTYKAELTEWRRAVSEAKQFFKTKRFRDEWYLNHKQSAKRILKLLHHPNYDFNRDEWLDFYRIDSMGHLIPINRDKVFRQRARLTKALRELVDTATPVSQRIDDVLSTQGRAYVKNLGINIASKILASTEPNRWPVWNGAIRDALDEFGYASPRAATPGEKYLAFAELMGRFMKESKAPDMLALDCFFYWKSTQTGVR